MSKIAVSSDDDDELTLDLSTYEGSGVEIQPLEVIPKREHFSGCTSGDLLHGTINGPCIDCPYFPFRDSSDPCVTTFELHGILLSKKKKVKLLLNGALGEALYRIAPKKNLIITQKKEGLVEITASPLEKINL